MIWFFGYPLKDPNQKADYTVNWQTWLGPAEKIVSATWSAPSGIAIGSSAYGPTISSDGKKLHVWLIGGTAGTGYRIRMNVITDNVPPREEDAEMIVDMAEL
jgi:hypothetical protein